MNAPDVVARAALEPDPDGDEEVVLVHRQTFREKADAVATTRRTAAAPPLDALSR